MKRILVAEDDFVISKLYQIHFKRNNLHGSFFTTGAGVLESARHEPPDLVLLDFELPDLRGPEVMRELRQIPGCEVVPVIFVTGRATPRSWTTCARKGRARSSASRSRRSS
ncbi:response regulator [bacterium]|nr:response regulator [bacterium]